jgi:hypothetical protein
MCSGELLHGVTFMGVFLKHTSYKATRECREL